MTEKRWNKIKKKNAVKSKTKLKRQRKDKRKRKIELVNLENLYKEIEKSGPTETFKALNVFINSKTKRSWKTILARLAAEMTTK